MLSARNEKYVRIVQTIVTMGSHQFSAIKPDFTVPMLISKPINQATYVDETQTVKMSIIEKTILPIKVSFSLVMLKVIAPMANDKNHSERVSNR